MGVSADAPYLDSAYKLAEYAGRPMLKTSPGKATMPGCKQVFRSSGPPDSADVRDLIGLRGEPGPAGGQPLPHPVLLAGPAHSATGAVGSGAGSAHCRPGRAAGRRPGDHRPSCSDRCLFCSGAPVARERSGAGASGCSPAAAAEDRFGGLTSPRGCR